MVKALGYGKIVIDDAEAYGVQKKTETVGFVFTVSMLGKAHHALLNSK